MARTSRARAKVKYSIIRLPLPGQSHEQEHDLREKLTEQFQPQDVVEERWLEDIAYCQARIDHDRAVIAAFKMRCVQQAHERQFAPVHDFASETDVAPEMDPVVEGWLDLYAQNGFVAPPGMTHTGESAFALLLGQLSARELGQLRLLQIMLHEEMRERDRIINQLHRTRRQAMRDAIEFAHVLAPPQEPAALAGPQENVEALDSGDADEHESPQPDAVEPTSSTSPRGSADQKDDADEARQEPGGDADPRCDRTYGLDAERDEAA